MSGDNAIDTSIPSIPPAPADNPYAQEVATLEQEIEQLTLDGIPEDAEEQQQLTEALESLNQLMQRIIDDDNRPGASAGGSRGGSLFEILASVMGEKMMEKLGEMKGIADQISNSSGEEIGKLTPQLTAASQEFQMLSQSFNTSINALGTGTRTAGTGR